MRDDDTPKGQPRRRLDDRDIRSGPQVGRRALLTGALGVAGLAGAGCVPARPVSAPRPVTSGITDNDVGQFADPAGNGRGVRPTTTGITDNDVGQFADPAGNGRGVQPSTAGFTDGDSGQFADPVSQGRAGVRTGLADNDGGQWADMPGGGRWGSGLTDSDAGPYLTDGPGNGRRGF